MSATIDLLAISPHPDDAEIFCGGLLAKSADAGYKTAVVDLTQGELGSQGTVEERKKESEAASEIIGLTKRINLALPDGKLSQVAAELDEQDGLKKLVELLRELRPSIVLVPYKHGRHPDHEAASQLAKKALYFAALKNFAAGTSEHRHVPKQVLYYQLRYEMQPNFIVDISAQAEKKMKAICCYRSQVTRQDTTVKTLVSSPLLLTSNDARDRYYGAMIGCEHGEAYLSRSMIRIDDPIAHFSSQTTTGALFFQAE